MTYPLPSSAITEEAKACQQHLLDLLPEFKFSNLRLKLFS